MPCHLALQAKMPLLALLGGSLLAERVLVDWLHAWLAVGHDGEVGHSRNASPECCRFSQNSSEQGSQNAADVSRGSPGVCFLFEVQVVLSLPAWTWLPLGPAAAATSPTAPPLWQFSFKWLVRRVAAALAVAVLSYCWLSHRDYERESFL